MLFLFRSAPEVKKRIHSKLFRKFWEEPGYTRANLHYCTFTLFIIDFSQVTDIDMLRYYSSRVQKGPSQRRKGSNLGGKWSESGGKNPEGLAQSVVLGLQFWVGAKHFRDGRMEV